MNDTSMAIETILNDCQQAIQVRHKIEQENKLMFVF